MLFLDIDNGDLVKLMLAILGPIVGLTAAGGFLFRLLKHRTRRKRPHQNKLIIDSENEPSTLRFSFSSPTSAAACHPPDIVATPAGDSTLKVRKTISLH